MWSCYFFSFFFSFLFFFKVGVISLSRSPPSTMRNHQTSERKRASIFQKFYFPRFFSHNPIFLIIFYPFILGLFLSVSLLIFLLHLSLFSLYSSSISSPALLSLSEHLFLAVAHEKLSSSPICIAMHFGKFLCLHFNNS